MVFLSECIWEEGMVIRHVDPSGYGITMEDLGWRYGLGAAYKPS